MALKRRRRSANQIPKNIRVIIAALISIILDVVLVVVIVSTINGAVLTNWKVGTLFLGLAFNLMLFIYDFRQLKSPGFDTKTTVLCTFTSFVSFVAFSFIYVIGFIS